MGKTIDDRQRQRVRELTALGFSADDIARQLGMTKMQVAAIKAHLTVGQTPLPSAGDPFLAARQVPIVTPAPNDESSMRHLDGRAVTVGVDETTTHKVEWFFESNQVGNPHLMVLGESGFGKTYAIQCMLSELSRLQIPSIVIDLGQSFDLATSPPLFRTVAEPKELLVGHKGISVNPLEIRSSDLNGPVNVAVRVADTFARIYNIGIQQQALLRDAVLEAYSAQGIRFQDEATWRLSPPPLASADQILEGWAEDDTNPSQTVARTLRAHLSNFFIFNTFRSDGISFSWQNLLEERRVMIINLKGLEGKTQKVVSEFLLWDLYSFVAAQGPRPIHSFVVLDEAHNLSFEKDTPVDKMIREARKFGIGLILASQQPSDFSETVFNNTGSKLFFQVADDKDKVSKRLRMKSSGMSDRSLQEVLGRLPRGHAVFLSANRSQVVRITSFEERFGRL